MHGIRTWVRVRRAVGIAFERDRGDGNHRSVKFSGKYAHRMIEGGIGHNLPQEAPLAFAEAGLEVAES
jgi:hypothetical protein